MKLTKRIIVLFLIVALCFSQMSCSSNRSATEDYKNPAISENIESKDFKTFTDELFAELISPNTLTLHSMVEHPENYGIHDYKISLGSYKTEDLDSTSKYMEILNKLKQFNKDELSPKQQLAYEQLTSYFQTELEYSDLYMLSTQLTPTTGIQITLPIVFAEYSLKNKNDVDNYIKLLCQTDTFFNELMEFEKRRADMGIFMQDNIADKIIDQCELFLKNLDDNFLISTFNSRISTLTDLSDNDKENYKTQNEDAINTHVIPAYKNMIQQVASLKGKNQYLGGLSSYPGGKKFYEYLLANELGWSKSIEELDSLLDKYINLSTLQISTLLTKDPSLIDKASDFSFPITDPKQILSDLEEKIKDDFPKPPDVNYEIKYVDKSLENYSSPAMYFLPQIDNFAENNIYINNKNSDKSTLYSTLAHEGYPGHMYQSTYFASTEPTPVRMLLKPDGYMEGWASYCELYSYELSDAENKEVMYLMQANYEAILMLYSKVDIGINYHGWSIEDTGKFLAKYGFSDKNIAKEMYEAMIAEPGNYPKYSLGCIAFLELKNTAQTALGEKFNLKEFHKMLMELGPMQFDLIEKHMETWIKAQS